MFEFTVISAFGNRKREIEKLVDDVAGVIKVAVSDNDPVYELSVTVEFKGAADAIRKHKAIAKVIQKSGYLTIAAVKTVLTDIYD